MTKKQIWIPETKKIPSIRNVLFEKTTIDKEGFCLFVNGIIIVANYTDYILGKNRMSGIKNGYGTNEYALEIIMVSMPIEIICKDSKILWRLSKYSFRARIYLDSVNDKFVINKL